MLDFNNFAIGLLHIVSLRALKKYFEQLIEKCLIGKNFKKYNSRKSN